MTRPISDDRKIINIAFATLPPYCLPKFNENGTVVGLAGNHGRIIDAILQFYKWRAVYKTSNEDGYGKPSENGTWNSVMGFLTRNEADISSPMTISLSRAAVTPFSIPLLYEEVTFATLVPGYLNKMFVTVKPFSVQVWVVSLLTIVTFGVIMTLFNAIRETSTKLSGNGRQIICLDIIGNIVTPGLYSDTKFMEYLLSTRVALSSWSLFMLILSLIYSGTLISYLTAPLKAAPIDTLETLVHLLNNNGYSTGSLSGLSTHYVIELAAASSNLRIKYPKRAISASKSRKEAVNRMLAGKYAFVWLRFWFTDVFLELGEHTLHKFHIAEESMMTMFLSIGISKKSQLKEKIDKVLLIQLESGLIRKFTDDILVRARINGLRHDPPDDEELKKYKESITSPLKLSQLTGGFFILGLGYGISFLVFAREVSLRCHRNSPVHWLRPGLRKTCRDRVVLSDRFLKIFRGSKAKARRIGSKAKAET